MILLEVSNRILEESILQRFAAGKKEAVDITLADFDGVTFHVATNPQQRNLVTVSIGWKCIPEIARFGVDATMKRIYGNMVQPSPEGVYDVTLQFDIDAITSPDQQNQLAKSIGLFKRHVMAVPFHAVFESVTGGGGHVPSIVTMNYRGNEALYIKPEGDRVIVIFSINFKDSDDVVLSKVFLQEFMDARRTMSNAPSVLFTQKESPLELKGVEGVYEGADQGFVSFVLFKNHIIRERRERTIDSICAFRNYLHYHIKCSKAFMHTRMRMRVESLLQVLNRAKMKKAIKATTVSGRTFERKV